MLFEIWIVDASIFQTRVSCVAVGSDCLLCMPVVIVAGVCWFFVACCVCIACLLRALLSGRPVVFGWVCWGGGGWWCGVTSCEGRMVDALASRADEGRRSLR